MPPQTAPTPVHERKCAEMPTGSAKGQLRWAQLLKRLFDRGCLIGYIQDS